MKYRGKLVASLLMGLLFLAPQIRTQEEAIISQTYVPPQESDFQLSLTDDQTNTILQPGDEIKLTISYRSLLKNSAPARIKVSWSQGRSEDGLYFSVFDYQLGSATSSPEGINPTINLNQREISWVFSALEPKTASQSVSLTLKVSSSLPSNTSLTAAATAQVTLYQTSLSPKTKEYQIITPIEATATPSPSLTPTPTPQPTSQPTTTPTATPTPTPIPQLKLKRVSFDLIGSREALISWQTEPTTSFQFRYGRQPNQLDQVITNLQTRIRHQVHLDQLEPNQNYYFQIRLQTPTGHQLDSEIFTFTTAAAELLDQLQSQTIRLQSDRFLLSRKKPEEKIVLTQHQSLVITVEPPNPETILVLRARFRNSQVLGINNFTPPPNEGEVELIEISPGVFSGELLTPNQPGRYQLLLIVIDQKGQRFQKIIDDAIFLSPPLRVVNQKNGQPVENARITILRFSDKQKQFLPLGQGFALAHYTDEKGELALNLPPGHYRFQIEAPGFRFKTVTLALGKTDFRYPQIKLIPETSLISRWRYYQEITRDLIHFSQFNLSQLFGSRRSRDWFTLVSSLIALIQIINLTWLRRYSWFARHGLWLINYPLALTNFLTLTLFLIFHLDLPRLGLWSIQTILFLVGVKQVLGQLKD